jgi:hypothetical protein
MSETQAYANSSRFDKLSPIRLRNPRNSLETTFDNPRSHYKKHSFTKLPSINRVRPDFSLSPSPVNREFKNRTEYKNYYDVRKLQRENNALRDFIHNFHLKQRGQKVVSTLDELTNGTTYAIAGKVQRYFSQLEDYVKKL